VDQLAGRFDNVRGRFGMLFFRESDNMVRLKSRCKDFANQGNGVILPIDDDFIINCLERIENDNRRTIDAKLEELFQQVIS